MIKESHLLYRSQFEHISSVELPIPISRDILDNGGWGPQYNLNSTSFERLIICRKEYNTVRSANSKKFKDILLTFYSLFANRLIKIYDCWHAGATPGNGKRRLGRDRDCQLPFSVKWTVSILKRPTLYAATNTWSIQVMPCYIRSYLFMYNSLIFLANLFAKSHPRSQSRAPYRDSVPFAE